MMASTNNVILAEDIRPFTSQVAGHACQTDKHSPGMLKHKDGFVLKPLLKQTQAKTELEFYKGLASSPHVDLTPFIAQFHGTAKINIGSYSGEVIILEDVTGKLEKPCIMDIKIGRQTWDPFASASKIEAEEKKYTECKRELGFCIPGFQVYDSESCKVVKYDKSYGKSLNKSTVLEAFSIFLNLHNQKHAAKAIELYISKLEEISNIISKQKQLHLYSSSILLSYDCEKLGTNVGTQTDMSNNK